MGEYKDLAGEIKNLTNARVLLDEPMSKHTSFKIGGPCDILVFPGSVEDIAAVWSLCNRMSAPWQIIGNGSNLLVKDGGIRGCAIKMAPGFSGVELRGKTTLYARSGLLLPKLVQTALEYGLSGLEFATGIPGSVGGAVTMNAGAYNGDFGSLAARVEAYSLSGERIWLNGTELDFSYRHSVFQSRRDLLILGVELALTEGDREAMAALMQSRSQERQMKQPLDLPSAGSAFRRPEGHYVGYMIEKLGLKGFSVGGAQVSQKHAGFIVNTGNATAKDVLDLMGQVKEKVKEAFQVELEPEIMVIGEDDNI